MRLLLRLQQAQLARLLRLEEARAMVARQVRPQRRLRVSDLACQLHRAQSRRLQLVARAN